MKPGAIHCTYCQHCGPAYDVREDWHTLPHQSSRARCSHYDIEVRTHANTRCAHFARMPAQQLVTKLLQHDTSGSAWPTAHAAHPFPTPTPTPDAQP